MTVEQSNVFTSVVNNGVKKSPNKKLYEEIMNTNTSTSIDIPIVSSYDLSKYTHSYKLPSKGLFYKNRTSEVLLMPLTIGQLCDIDQALKIANEPEKLRKLFTILSHSIYGISAFDMTLPDFYSVCIELRSISYRDEPISLITETIDEDGNKSTELCYLCEPLQTQVINESLVDNDSWSFTTVSDKLYELEHENELNNLEKLLFGLVKGDSPEEKHRNFRSSRISDPDLLVKHLVDSAHGLVYRAVVMLESTSEKVETDFQFSFNLLFPRLCSELLLRL